MIHKTTHAIIEGKVQGVCFREYTRQEACRAGVTGWVRNRTDGTVEALFSGSNEKVEFMCHWLHQGSPLSVVKKVDITILDESEYFSDFQIRF